MLRFIRAYLGSFNSPEIPASSGDNSLQLFEQIGKGQCGEVWAQVGATIVFKALNSQRDPDDLANDAIMHKAVMEAFDQAPSAFRSEISLPRFYQCINKDNQEWWAEHSALFPSNQLPTYAIEAERILPVPEPVREALVNAFLPVHLKSQRTQLLMNKSNKDCLVRLYLGLRYSGKKAASSSFTLRNFELLVDEMEGLKLPTTKYASVMADALALMHFNAHVDANDVEFVLGTSPAIKGTRLASEMIALMKSHGRDSLQLENVGRDFKKRSLHIWLLDFNQCKHVEDNPGGMKLMVDAFWFNDPYYPRPVSTDPKDQALWTVFRDRYLQMAKKLGYQELSEKFVTEVENNGAKRQAAIANQGAGSLFGEIMK